MTREEAKKIVNLYSIIEAYANGETIEVFDGPGKWKELEKYGDKNEYYNNIKKLLVSNN